MCAAWQRPAAASFLPGRPARATAPPAGPPAARACCWRPSMGGGRRQALRRRQLGPAVCCWLQQGRRAPQAPPSPCPASPLTHVGCAAAAPSGRGGCVPERPVQAPPRPMQGGPSAACFSRAMQLEFGAAWGLGRQRNWLWQPVQASPIRPRRAPSRANPSNPAPRCRSPARPGPAADRQCNIPRSVTGPDPPQWRSSRGRRHHRRRAAVAAQPTGLAACPASMLPLSLRHSSGSRRSSAPHKVGRAAELHCSRCVAGHV